VCTAGVSFDFHCCLVGLVDSVLFSFGDSLGPSSFFSTSSLVGPADLCRRCGQRLPPFPPGASAIDLSELVFSFFSPLSPTSSSSFWSLGSVHRLSAVCNGAGAPPWVRLS
jgi:hypothetical protein